MSSMQTFFDLGAQMGLLGAQHARDHRPFAADRTPPLSETVRVVHEYTGSTAVVLTDEHEPGRVVGVRNRVSNARIEHALCVKRAACGVFVARHEMETHDVRTILLPVCDHPVIGVQMVDDANRVLGFGALRATPDRLCGNGSVIAALFEHLEQQHGLLEQTRRICFHLSAGRGPCCMQDDVKSHVRAANEKLLGVGFDEFDARDFITNGGFDMLKALTAEIRRWTYTQQCEFTVNARDRDCTVCCAEQEGMPYYSAEFNRFNLAVFSSELEIPERPLWC